MLFFLLPALLEVLSFFLLVLLAFSAAVCLVLAGSAGFAALGVVPWVLLCWFTEVVLLLSLDFTEVVLV